MNLFAEKAFDHDRFATETPTFPVRLAPKIQVDITAFGRIRMPKVEFGHYDIDNINIFSLLVQTGYLPITKGETTGQTLRDMVSYPNREVKEAFVTYLLDEFTTHRFGHTQTATADLRESLEEEKLEEFIAIMRSLLSFLVLYDRRADGS